MLKQIIGTCTGTSHAWVCIMYIWLGVHKLQPQRQRTKGTASWRNSFVSFLTCGRDFQTPPSPSYWPTLTPAMCSCPSSAELCLLTRPVAGAVPLGMAFSRFLCEAEHVPAAKITSLYTLWKQEQQRHICLVWAEPACN